MTQKPFNPRDHLIELKSKNGVQEYLPVQWRLVFFREACPQGEIMTEVVMLDLDRECTAEVYTWNNETRKSEKTLKRAQGYAMFKATVKDGKGGSATGYKSENAASFREYAEKAETGAIGRALAALGYGTQFAPELDEEHRIVDSPVITPPGASTQDTRSAPASEQQKESIKKLRLALGKPLEMRTLTYGEAKETIAVLSHEYNEIKAKGRVS